MKTREIALLGSPFAAGALLAWYLGGDDLAVLIGIVVGTAWFRFSYQRWALEQAARTASSMGPQSDSIVGFDARVVTVEPLQVEVRGSTWRARLVEGCAVAPEARVRVVGREVLTLLVAAPKPETDRG